LGGDILSFITGRIADAFYAGMPEFIGKQTLSYLVVECKGITEQFIQKYCNIQPRPYNLECDVPINSGREKMSQHRWLVVFIYRLNVCRRL
jgi:hypothetical protein